MFYRDINPYENADIISKVLFTWCIKYFFKIHKIASNTLYLFDVPSNGHSLHLGVLIEGAWATEMQRARKLNKRPKMIRVILKIFNTYKLIIVCTILTVFRCCTIGAFQPLLIGYTMVNVAFINVSDEYEIAAVCLLMALLIICFLIDVCLSKTLTFIQQMQGQKIEVALRNLIYKKIFSLTKKVYIPQEMDNLLELLNTNMSEIELTVWSISIVLSTPIIVAMYTLIFGYLFLQTIYVINLYLVFGVLVQMLCFYCLSKSRKKLKQQRKIRFAIISDVMEKIKTLKIVGQEKMMLDLINNQKSKEWKFLLINNLLNGFNVSIFSYIYILILGAGIIVYSKNYCCMGLKRVLILLMIIIKLGSLVTVHFAHSIYTLVNSWNLLYRIETFLLLEDTTGDIIKYNDNGAIEFHNVTSMKSTIYFNPIFNITFIVPSGKLCILIGAPNSGKNAIIPLITQELGNRSGSITLGGTLAYYTKTDVLLDTTLKKNITLDREFDKKHYKYIKKICGLITDFKKYPDKDNTNVNDMSVSPTIKAKIILARTLYEEADIYLFKFPLPHATNSVGREIFETCILQYLKDKTRLIETFEESLLEKADLILFFNNGRITAADTYKNLKQIVPNLNDILQEDFDNLSYSRLSTTKEIMEQKRNEYTNRDSLLHQKELLFYQIPTTTLILKYIQASGFPFATIFQLITALSLCLFLLVYQYSTIKWGCDNLVHDNNYNKSNLHGFISFIHVFDRSVSKKPLTQKEVKIYKSMPIIYAISISVNTCLEFIRILTSSLICACASNNLYKQIIKSILFAPVTYLKSKHLQFVYPMVLKDINALEDILPTKILEIFRTVTIIVCLTVMYYFLNKYYTLLSLIMILMGLIMNQLLFKVVKDIRFVKEKIDEKLQVHIEHTLSSLSIIQSAGVEETFIRQFSHTENLHSSIKFLYFTIHNAFSFWNPTIFMLCHSGLMYYLILKSEKDFQEKLEWISMIFINYYYIYHTISTGTKMFAVVASNSIKIKTLFDIIPTETEEDYLQFPNDSKLPPQWPIGKIEFKNITITFSDGIPLKDINFTINAEQKVAVLKSNEDGKTGIIMALLRLHPYSGTILIDDIDIDSIGLQTLRHQISYLSPKLEIFNCNLKVMFKEFNDRDVWDALEKVDLKGTYSSLEDNASYKVNLATRLLLHLARALLIKNKILVLDKITEGISKKKVQLINSIVKKYFHNCTIIKICTKFEEAESCDRVILMGEGQIIDDDIPDIIRTKYFKND